MAVRRSLDFWLVAYFLSRCGQRRPHGRLPSPPTQLGESWHEAYSFFFLKLNGGRTLSVFSHSLKNARDAFDGHHDSGRVGWRDPDSTRPPKLLNADAATVLAEWKNRTDAELWSAIEPFADFCTRGLSDSSFALFGRKKWSGGAWVFAIEFWRSNLDSCGTEAPPWTSLFPRLSIF